MFTRYYAVIVTGMTRCPLRGEATLSSGRLPLLYVSPQHDALPRRVRVGYLAEQQLAREGCHLPYRLLHRRDGGMDKRAERCARDAA